MKTLTQMRTEFREWEALQPWGYEGAMEKLEEIISNFSLKELEVLWDDFGSPEHLLHELEGAYSIWGGVENEDRIKLHTNGNRH